MSALKQITTAAKAIYKKGGTWKTAIKKAGAMYRAKKKKAPAKKRRKVSGTLSAGSRPASYSIGKVKRRKRRIGATLSDSPRPAGYAIGGLTASAHIAHAKKKIGEQIALAELSKFKAPKKSAKNKISKKITALKSRYRKLC